MILLFNCRYERFVIALEEASRDMLPILKDKALKVGGPDMPCPSLYQIYMHMSTQFCSICRDFITTHFCLILFYFVFITRLHAYDQANVVVLRLLVLGIPHRFFV